MALTYRKRYNLCSTTLDTALTDVDTDVVFDTALKEGGAAGTNIATLGTDEYLMLRIDDEIVALSAYTSGATSGTIVRAQEGTIAVAHNTVGVPVKHVGTKQDDDGAMPLVAGASDGDVVTWDDVAGEWQPQAPAAGTESVAAGDLGASETLTESSRSLKLVEASLSVACAVTVDIDTAGRAIQLVVDGGGFAITHTGVDVWHTSSGAEPGALTGINTILYVRLESGDVHGYWADEPAEAPAASVVPHAWPANAWSAGPSVRFSGVTAATAITTATLYYEPFEVTSEIVLNKLCIEPTLAGAAGTVARLGIASLDDLFQPDDLVLDAGTVAVDALNVQSITGLTTTLTPGWYAKILVSDGTPTLRYTRGDLGLRDAGTNTQLRQIVNGLTVGMALGAFADPPPDWTTPLTSTTEFHFLHFVHMQWSQPA